MEIFNFDKNDLTRYIEYELKTVSKFKEPLNYVIKSLEKLGSSLTIKSLDKAVNLSKIKENEGKNYHWSVINYKNVTLVIRRYEQHMTIYTKVVKESIKGYDKSEYGAFSLNTDMDKFGDKHDEMMDKYWSKPFTDLNVIIKDLLNMLIDRTYGVSWVWNSAALKRPDHVELKLAFCNNNITSLDDFTFCMEEISYMYQKLFAESTMVQKLKEYVGKTNVKLNDRYKAGEVTTTVKDGYYHAVGMDLIDTMDKNKESFKDVYSLTRYYFEEIFQEKIYIYNGEIYVAGGEFKVGEPVAYKGTDDFENVTIFTSTMPKENFIPLKKY
jgi:hypothetical protein